VPLWAASGIRTRVGQAAHPRMSQGSRVFLEGGREGTPAGAGVPRYLGTTSYAPGGRKMTSWASPHVLTSQPPSIVVSAATSSSAVKLAAGP